MVRRKVGAAEGRVGGGPGDLPRENVVKKTQNPAFWELLAPFWRTVLCSRVECSTVLSTTADA